MLYALISYFYANKLQNWKKNHQKVLLFLVVDNRTQHLSLCRLSTFKWLYIHAPYKHFDDLVTCVWKLMAACQTQAGDWAWRNHCQWYEKDVNMNIRKFRIVSNHQQKGIHLYRVLLVILTSHVSGSQSDYRHISKFVDEVESKGKNQIYRKLRFANI